MPNDVLEKMLSEYEHSPTNETLRKTVERLLSATDEHRYLFLRLTIPQQARLGAAEDYCEQAIALGERYNDSNTAIACKLYLAAATYGNVHQRREAFNHLLQLMQKAPNDTNAHKTLSYLLDRMPDQTAIRRQYLTIFFAVQRRSACKVPMVFYHQVAMHIAEADLSEITQAEAIKRAYFAIGVSKHGDIADRELAINGVKRLLEHYPTQAELYKILAGCYRDNPGLGDADRCLHTSAILGDKDALHSLHGTLSPQEAFELAKAENNHAAFSVLHDYLAADRDNAALRKLVGECHLFGYGTERNAASALILGVTRADYPDVPASTAASGLFSPSSVRIERLKDIAWFNLMLLGIEEPVDLFGATVTPSRYNAHQAQCAICDLVSTHLPAACEEKEYPGLEAQCTTNFTANRELSKSAWDPEYFKARLAANQTTSVAVHWSDRGAGHYCQLSFKKIAGVTYMMHADRGADPGGISVFIVQNQTQLMGNEFLTKLQYGYSTRKYVDAVIGAGGIGEELNLKPIIRLAQSKQKISNCALITGYSSLKTDLIFHFASQEDCKLSDGSIDFARALEQANVIFKPWRLSTRIEAINQLLSLGNASNELQLPAGNHQAIVNRMLDYIDRRDKITPEQTIALLTPIILFLRSDDCKYEITDTASLLTEIQARFGDDAFAAIEASHRPDTT